jgi:hypothetical protein
MLCISPSHALHLVPQEKRELVEDGEKSYRELRCFLFFLSFTLILVLGIYCKNFQLFISFNFVILVLLLKEFFVVTDK